LGRVIDEEILIHGKTHLILSEWLIWRTTKLIERLKNYSTTQRMLMDLGSSIKGIDKLIETRNYLCFVILPSTTPIPETDENINYIQYLAQSGYLTK